MPLNIGIKLILAALSGILVTVCWGMFPDEENLLGWLGLYGLSSLVFAAGVLGPYVTRDRSLRIRGPALVLACVLSYWSAVQITMAWDGPTWGPEFQALLTASAVGAGIVWLAAAIIIPLPFTARYALLVLPAAMIGGWLFYFGLTLTNHGLFFSYTSWHLTMAIALHWSGASKAAARN